MNAPPETGNPTLIEMGGVTIGTLRDTAAVAARDVNWRVRAGEFWIVAGLHSTGKSDFLTTTAGLMPPRAGELRLSGEPIHTLESARLAQRLKVGLVFQAPQLLNHLTVFENVALPLRYHRNASRAEVQDAVDAMLAATELLPWSASTPATMPRAWQKRAGLARALMLQPELLLLDCPLSGLDLRHASWWLEFLDGLSRGHSLLQSRPLTLVVTAEDLRMWRGEARQFALLEDQRFTVLGDWAQVEQRREATVRLLLEGHKAGRQPAPAPPGIPTPSDPSIS